jgi:hypothetical protein
MNYFDDVGAANRLIRRGASANVASFKLPLGDVQAPSPLLLCLGFPDQFAYRSTSALTNIRYSCNSRRLICSTITINLCDPQ